MAVYSCGGVVLRPREAEEAEAAKAPAGRWSAASVVDGFTDVEGIAGCFTEDDERGG